MKDYYYEDSSEDDYEDSFEDESEKFYENEEELEGGAYQLDYIDGMYGEGRGGVLYGGAGRRGVGATPWAKFRTMNKGSKLKGEELKKAYRKYLKNELKMIDEEKIKIRAKRKRSPWQQFVSDSKGTGKSLEQLSKEYRMMNKMSEKIYNEEGKMSKCKSMGKIYNPKTKRCNKKLPKIKSLTLEERRILCEILGKDFSGKSGRCYKKGYLKNK